MIKEILFLVSGIALALLFLYIRSKIIARAKTTVLEAVDGKKFWNGMLSFFDPVLWLKTLASMFNIRKIIIYITVLSVIFGFAYYRGQQGKPIELDIEFGKVRTVRVADNTYMQFQKDGKIAILDKNKKFVRYITVGDVPELNRRLRPMGLQLKPIAVMGIGYGKDGKMGMEAGAGVSFFRFYKHELDLFLTQRSINIGTSYMLTDNMAVGVSVGKEYKKMSEADFRAMLYVKFKF